MADYIKIPKPMAEAIRMAMNFIPNTVINQGRYRETYDIANDITKIIDKEGREHPGGRRIRKG